MRALVAGLAAAGLVAAGVTAASAGTVTRPYTVTISHGGHKTTYRCHTAGVSRGRLGGRGCIPVLRPRVTLDAHIVNGGDPITQQGTYWNWRITQPGNGTVGPGVLVIDDVYNGQNFQSIDHSPPNGLFEIQLEDGGGAFQGDCVTWNQSLLEFDAIPCAWKVSQEWNQVNWDYVYGDGNLQNWYSKNCAQAQDYAGEGSTIELQQCGDTNNTVWDFNG